jgi:hypothetical protein
VMVASLPGGKLHQINYDDSELHDRLLEIAEDVEGSWSTR